MNDMLKKLVKAHGVSSGEGEVARIIAELLGGYVDEIKTDALGNLIAYKASGKENAKKLMLTAHMDEIGFMVNYIEDNGYLRISRIGGINYIAAAYEQVVFSNGTRGIIAPEGGVKSGDYKPDSFYVDIGVKSRAEAEKRVRLGMLCSLQGSITRICATRYAGRPLDDRIGCYVLIEAARRIKDPANDIYYVFSVQEEVGLRGAVAATYNVMPDIGIAVDVTPTGDTIKAKPSAVKLGGGAAIKIKDASVICDINIVSEMRRLAKENGIKYQNEVLESGGTDTYSMQINAEGVKVGCISVPTRYIHTQNEMIDMKDVDSAISLAVLCGENEY